MSRHLLADRPAPRRRIRARTVVLALLLAAAAMLLAARPARAGEYVVTQCSSVNPSAGQASWERSTDNYAGRAHCGTDAGLQVYHAAQGSDLWHFGAWVWRAPPGTVFTNVQANASLTYQAGHRGQLIATRPSGELVEFGAEHNDFRVHAIAGEFSQFHAWLRCVAPGSSRPCGRAGYDSAHAYVRGVFLRTADRAVPSLTATGGSLLRDPVVRGVRGLTFDAHDAGGGIRIVHVEANGVRLVTDVRNCALAGGYATALSPCPLTTSESAVVPTADPAFATGPNAVAACATDLALDGPANRACEQRWVWVDNACPGSAVGGGTALGAGFGPDAAATTTVRSDRRAVIRGRLAGAGAGATICALTRTHIANSPIVVAATATTGADGAYALELPPGPSRDVFVHYAHGERVVARHGLSQRSIVRPTLVVRPNHGVRRGDRLRFSGRVPGPSCAGRVVKVQARIGKRRWQVFRTDRADGDCAFTARYKLRATRRARRYRFRARVPGQAGYPYEPGHSKTARVKVRRRR
jgi:hypothetical protein